MAVYALWWGDAVLAIVAILLIPFHLAVVSPPGVSGLLPSAQLPLVAALTCAATGAAICQSANAGGALSVGHKVPAVVVSYLLVGTAIPLTLFLDGLFSSRLFNN